MSNHSYRSSIAALACAWCLCLSCEREQQVSAAPDQTNPPDINRVGTPSKDQIQINDGKEAVQTPETKVVTDWGTMSAKEFWLALVTLVFGAATLWCEYSLVQKLQPSAYTIQQLLPLFGVTLIIIGA